MGKIIGEGYSSDETKYSQQRKARAILDKTEIQKRLTPSNKNEKKPNMSIIRGLLFTYDIENTDDLKRENLISSKNINTEKELIELIDELTKPEFLSYTKQEQEWFIDSIEHYLSIGDNFDSIFKTMATYFSEPVINQQMFMRTLLGRLRQYRNTQ